MIRNLSSFRFCERAVVKTGVIFFKFTTKISTNLSVLLESEEKISDLKIYRFLKSPSYNLDS